MYRLIYLLKYASVSCCGGHAADLLHPRFVCVVDDWRTSRRLQHLLEHRTALNTLAKRSVLQSQGRPTDHYGECAAERREEGLVRMLVSERGWVSE